MLGYIRTQGPELRLRDYEIYRALYCGLCRHMGKCTGQCSRFSLSYDFVFLAAVRISILNEPVTTILSRCPVHPLHKRKTVKDSETLKYCADASALLTYHKCRDDLADERGFKKMRGWHCCCFPPDIGTQKSVIRSWTLPFQKVLKNCETTKRTNPFPQAPMRQLRFLEN